MYIKKMAQRDGFYASASIAIEIPDDCTCF